jgi:hypothetical protein
MTIVSSINARRPAYFSLDSCRNKDINKLKINVNNGFPHELVKFIVLYRLRQNGHDVVTEGIFRNGKRCDLIDLSSNVIYEVLNTERIENIDLKQAKYPAKIYPLFVKDLNFIGSLDSLRNSYDKKLEI